MVRVLGALGLLLGLAALAVANEDPPAAARPGPPAGPRAPGPASADTRFQEGLAQAKQRDWRGAEIAYRDALRAKPAFPEAWNALGFALRQQGRYADSIPAYQEALRLRPDYPQALEYLGEAYVRMGRLDEARAILTRLRPLDAREADELARAIERASTGR